MFDPHTATQAEHHANLADAVEQRQSSWWSGEVALDLRLFL